MHRCSTWQCLDSMSSSPLVAALDPRVDEQMVQEQMQTAVVEPSLKPTRNHRRMSRSSKGRRNHQARMSNPHGLSRARP